MVLASAIFVGSGLVLVPAFQGYGAAAAQIIAFSVAAAIVLWRAQLSEHPLEIQYGKLARAIGIGLLCILLGRLLSPLVGQWSVLIDLAILAAFPALLVLANAFPGEELRAFVNISRPSLPRRLSRSRHRSAIAKQVGRLDPADRQALSALVANGASAAEVASALSISEQEMLGRFLASLRELAPLRTRTNGSGEVEETGELAHSEAGIDEEGTETAVGEENGEAGVDATEGEEKEPKDPAELEAELAAYLLSRRGTATRDGLAERLCEDGVNPMDIDDLDCTMGRLRRISRREWERLAS
jgi:hypothetical protein